MMTSWNTLADAKRVNKTMAALKGNGIDSVFVQTKDEAKTHFLKILPYGAEVMNNTSVTLSTIGAEKEILDSGKYDAVHKRLETMDPKKQITEMQRIGAAPVWAVGSVHAITEQGEVLIASKTGSQLPGYAYGAQHVVWVAGTHKIVRDRQEGLKRIYEYCLPLEAQRAQKAYGEDSYVAKILIINKEFQEHRIILIFVNEVLGF
jgi:hypothetical protein